MAELDTLIADVSTGIIRGRSDQVCHIICRAVLKSENFEYAVRLLYLIRFFRTFGAGWAARHDASRCTPVV
jgi:hypothetical protein